MKVRKAVIPVAGFGTRFLPVTKAVPKGMLPIIDKPAIEYVVRELVEAGITDILFIESGYQQSIKDYFESNPELEKLLLEKNKPDYLQQIKELNHLANISYTMQLDKKGTGGAVSYAKDFVGEEPFVVIYCDDVFIEKKPAISNLIESYNKTQEMAVGTIIVSAQEANRYGVVMVDENNYFKNYVEKPVILEDKKFNAIVGRYLLTPDIFDYLDKLEPHYEGEIYLMDAVLEMMKDNHKMKVIPIEGTYRDLGNKVEFVKTIISESLKREDMKDEILKYIKEVIK